MSQADAPKARRLMLNEDLDTASAAFEVGSQSPSQFNCEYPRLQNATSKRCAAGPVAQLKRDPWPKFPFLGGLTATFRSGGGAPH